MDREDDHGEEVKGEEETREKEKGRSGQKEENTESGQEGCKEGHEEKGDEGKEGGAEAQSAGEAGTDVCTAARTRPVLAAGHRRHERWRNGHCAWRQ
jgi:hypothetical protein